MTDDDLGCEICGWRRTATVDQLRDCGKVGTPDACRKCLECADEAIDTMRDRSERTERALLGKTIAAELGPQERIELALSILRGASTEV